MIAGLWKILVPYRVEIFVWLAMLGTLNTKDKLIRLGILEASNGPCLLCNSEPESGEHALFSGFKYVDVVAQYVEYPMVLCVIYFRCLTTVGLP